MKIKKPKERKYGSRPTKVHKSKKGKGSYKRKPSKTLDQAFKNLFKFFEEIIIVDSNDKVIDRISTKDL